MRPIKPFDDHESIANDDDDCAYVIVISGEFLQLLSDGSVPTCIHRVVPPKPSLLAAPKNTFTPRISAPLFVRPRRREDAIFVASDLTMPESESGLYFEEGLKEECDKMHIWEYMNCVSPGN